MRGKHSQVDLICLVICSGLAAALAMGAPLFHNPDANFYYGVALRVSRGQFLSSVDGLYSPLLSWLMAGPVALGMPLSAAYHLVNFVALVFILAALSRLADCFQLPEMLRVVLYVLTFAQILYFAFILITSDVLAAALNSWIAVLLLTQLNSARKGRAALIGLLGALAYLAKALQLPIFVLVISGFGAYRILSKRASVGQEAKLCCISLLLCTLISAPWIYLLSQKYGTFAISGQQLIFTNNLALRDYHPDLVSPDYLAAQPNVSLRPGVKQSRILLSDVAGVFERWKELVALSLITIVNDVRTSFACVPVFLIWVILATGGCLDALRLRRVNGSGVLLALLIGCQVIVYMNVWGGRFRYYLPILPAANLCFASSLEALQVLKSKYQVRGLVVRLFGKYASILVGAAVIGAVFTATGEVWRNVRGGIDLKAIEAMEQIPAIALSEGALTGRVHGVYAGLVAARLKREYWNSVDPERGEGSAVLRRKLREWRVKQVIWEGKPPAELDQAVGSAPELVYEQDEFRIYLYEFN